MVPTALGLNRLGRLGPAIGTIPVNQVVVLLLGDRDLTSVLFGIPTRRQPCGMVYGNALGFPPLPALFAMLAFSSGRQTKPVNTEDVPVAAIALAKPMGTTLGASGRTLN